MRASKADQEPVELVAVAVAVHMVQQLQPAVLEQVALVGKGVIVVLRVELVARELAAMRGVPTEQRR
jgi:hypothetical protein